jgi:type II secretory pathway component PulM
MEDDQTGTLSHLDRYIILMVSLAWAVNLVALALLWNKGNPRALHKSAVTVAGATVVLVYYLIAFLRPALRDATWMKLLQAVGWAVMVLGFAYFWIAPFWRLPRGF